MGAIKINEKEKRKYLNELTEESLETLIGFIEESTDYEMDDERDEENCLVTLMKVPARYIFEADEYWEDEIKTEECTQKLLHSTSLNEVFSDSSDPIPLNSSMAKLIKYLEEMDKFTLMSFAKDWNQKIKKPRVKEYGLKKEIAQSFKGVERVKLIDALFDNCPYMFDSPVELEDCKTVKEILLHCIQLEDFEIKKIINKLKVKGYKFKKKERDELWADSLLSLHKELSMDDILEAYKVVVKE